jgi:hypothetical protein
MKKDLATKAVSQILWYEVKKVCSLTTAVKKFTYGSLDISTRDWKKNTRKSPIQEAQILPDKLYFSEILEVVP